MWFFFLLLFDSYSNPKNTLIIFHLKFHLNLNLYTKGLKIKFNIPSKLLLQTCKKSKRHADSLISVNFLN